MTSFIEELLIEAEIKEKEQRIEMSRLRADQLLQALTVLEKQADAVNELCDSEVKLIEEYRMVELQKLQKKMDWLSWNLEQFIRSTGEKTINLPHGSLRVRLGRDKIEITDLQKFMQVAERYGLLKQIPEKIEPDMEKLKAHIKSGNLIPQGVSLTPAQTHFTYNTKGNGNGKEETGD